MKYYLGIFVVLAFAAALVHPSFPALAHMHEGHDMKMQAPPASSPPVSGVKVGGAFSLTDHTGKAVTEKSWPGKETLVFFGFTRCPDICPATLQKVAAVMEKVDPEGKTIVPLFITVDPAYDTAEVMARYIEPYNAHIIGLTGTAEQIKKAADAYKVFFSEKSQGQVDHSAYLYLMSPAGELLEIFGSGAPVEDLIAKIKAH